MGTVVTYAVDEGLTEHEVAARAAVARSPAALNEFDFRGGYDPALQHDRPLYFVPNETLSGEEAARLGIRGADVDPQAGPLVNYTIVEPHGTAH